MAVLCMIICFLLTSGTPATADEGGEATPADIPRISDEINVDGLLNEAAWETAAVFPLAYEVLPGDNTPAPVETEMLLMYDSLHLYVGFLAHDPRPAAIRAHFRDRDSVYTDDYVGVIIDTFNDQRRAYEFISNSLGAQQDRIIDDTASGSDYLWNAIWKSAGTITDSGYIVEMAIPFTQIRIQDSAGPQTWGLDAIRVYPRDNWYLIALNPRDRSTESYLSQTQNIRGFADTARGENISLIPTLTLQRTDQNEGSPADRLTDGPFTGEAGLTGRWGVTANMTLNGTLNPDFSQVEADSVQLDINESFSLFFPETRPFFLDGADFFAVQRFNLLHTRTIAEPEYALKTTGKAGRHSYGLLTARDATTSIILPGVEQSRSAVFDFETATTAGRYRYDMGSNSTVGGMFTDRRGQGYASTAVSLDTRYRMTDSDSLSAAFIASSTTYNNEIARTFDLEKTDYAGYALSAYYRHTHRDYFFDSLLVDVSDGFRADLGFVPQTGHRKVNVGGGREWWGEKDSFFRRLTLSMDIDQSEDQSGGILEREAEGSLQGLGPSRSYFYLGGGARQRVFQGVRFDQLFYDAVFSLWPTGNLHANMYAGGGDAIDVANIREGTAFNTGAELQSSIGRHFFLNVSYDYTRLDVTGGRLFTTHVPQARLVYHLNNNLLFRAILQYVHIRRDPQLYVKAVDSLTEDLATQLLISYRLNPQTVVYAGYSDQHAGSSLVDLTRQSRTFFIKLGYAWLK